MRIHSSVVAGAVAAALAVGSLAACTPQSDGSAAQQGDASAWQQPVTEWGEPDLRGMWPIGHLTGVPLQLNGRFQATTMRRLPVTVGRK